ncbi:uncharacterized protein B0T15DRAFT_420885 [Chaetomium strumarium]
MSRWLRLWKPPVWRVPRSTSRCFQVRFLSAQPTIEHVRVPCASAGDITVSLHNVSKQDAERPLLIFIPPFSQPGPGLSTPLPSCLVDYPTAVIHYRWQAQEEEHKPELPLHWPTPLHDVSFGYSWIAANLGSGSDSSANPRPAYVCGSYLGASLAAGLALTEAHVPVRSLPMTIRGLVAHNGIYNWTMFLPDHPIHKLRFKPESPGTGRGLGFGLSSASVDDSPAPFEEEGIFTELKHLTRALFSDPSNLFDPFVSTCLFFHSADLHVPDDFTTPLFPPNSSLSDEFTAAVGSLAGSSTSSSSTSSPTPDTESAAPEEEAESAESLLAKAATLAKQANPPRKGYLAFPPRDSTLRLPPTLFLYDRPREYSSLHSLPHPPESPVDAGRRLRRRGASTSKSNFRVQAMELIGLMMRSLDMQELRPKGPPPWEWEWEGDPGGSGVNSARGEEDPRMREIERRVQSCELPSSSFHSLESLMVVDKERTGMGLGLLGKEGEAMVAEWLRERIDEDFGE